MRILQKARRAVEVLDRAAFGLQYTQCASDVYAEGPNAEWRAVYDAEKPDWPLPICFGGRSVSFCESLPAHFPVQGVAVVAGGRLVGPFGFAFGPDRTRLPWHSWHRDDFTLPIPVLRSEWNQAGARRLDGTVVSLMSEFSTVNHCHYIMDSLSRNHLAVEAGFADEAVDAYVVPGVASKRKIRQLERIGVPVDKVVWFGDTRGVTAERLVVTTFPGRARCYPRWAVEYIAERLGSHAPRPEGGGPGKRRLYVSRAGYARDLANYDELRPTLERYGFETYRPEDSADPIADFADAGAVISGHGAGLTDVIFSPSGGFVLELISERHIFPYYYTLAVNAGQRYGCLLGRAPYEDRQRRLENFRIEPEHFEAALAAIDAHLAGGAPPAVG